MANEPADKNAPLMHTVTRMLESAAEGGNYDSLISILSLICLVSILSRGQAAAAPAQAAPVTGGASPLQKLIGDLAKGEGGLGPETLVSLLPLLNNPQIKSKLNPSTLGAVMGMLGNMGNLGSAGDKGDKSETKAEKAAEKVADKAADKGEEKPEVRRNPPPTAATVTSIEALSDKPEAGEGADGEKKGLGRYLNWKSNF
jgi:hypothetical protein